ncbi:selenouridine synthase SelU-like subunit [Methanocaldococcus infernus]
MDEEILARLLTFNKDVYLCIFLKDGRKMIANSEKILAGKVGGEIVRKVIDAIKKMEEEGKEIFLLEDEKIYIEKINIKKFLSSITIPDDTITIDEALKKKDAIFIDVRSPREFKEKTIPGAINIPLFLDEEHALIGKVYKNEGKEKAMELAIDIVSKSLVRILNEVKKLDGNKEIIVFCARGGMRSRTVALILSLLGFKKVKRLIGGFKSYRHVEK